jgi:DNA modification methylase
MPQSMKVQEIETDRLKPWADNPRVNEHAVDAVARSIGNFGFNVPITCDQNLTIVAGHTRWKAAKKLGLQFVPVIVLELTELQRRAFAIADNRTAELAEWNWPQLRNVLDELRSEDIDLGNIGFSDEDLRRLLVGTFNSEDDIPALPEEPRTRFGDLVQIGQHRLLCGDSTRQDHVAVVVGGNKVDLVFAGPPCFNQRLYAHWDRFDAYHDDMRRVVNNSRSLLKAGAVAVWHVANDSSSNHDLTSHHSRLLEESGLIYVDTISWVKSQANYSTQRNTHILRNRCYYPAFQWEALLVFRDPAGKMPKMTREGSRYMANYHTNVWQLSLVTSQMAMFGHPAVSPVELPYRAIQAYTGSESVVFEPFGGSGTTLIAAGKAGRKALVVERIPSYCDQIIRRWEMMTQEKAKLLSNNAVDCSTVLVQADSSTVRPPEQREGFGHESSVAG